MSTIRSERFVKDRIKIPRGPSHALFINIIIDKLLRPGDPLHCLFGASCYLAPPLKKIANYLIANGGRCSAVKRTL